MGDKVKTINPLKSTSYKEQVSRSITWGHYFIFLNILLACLLGSSYVYAAPPTHSFISFFYLVVTLLGHMSFLSVVSYLLIFFPLAFIGNFRYYRVIAVSIAVLLHTILLFDIKIFLLVKIHLSLTAIGLIVRELDFDTGLNYNFLFIAIPFVIALECFFAKITTHSLYKAHHPIFVKSVLSIVGSCFVLSHLLHIWADATNYERITLLRSTFPIHYPMTAKSFLSGHGWINADLAKAKDQAYGQGREYINYPLNTIQSNPINNPHNVIIISFNGLSYQDLSVELTPELIRFKQSAQSFEHNYLLYKRELDNVFALNYGMPLQYRPIFIKERILPVTQEEMFRQDYVRRLIVSDNVLNSKHKNDTINLLQLAINQDDSYSLNERHYLSSLAKNSGLRDAQVQVASSDESALDYVINHAQHNRPFAFSIVLNDVRNAKRKFKEENAYQDDLTANLDPSVKARANFEKALQKSDAIFGAFINELKLKGILEHTLVIVTSTEGNTLNLSGEQIFERNVQHVPLMLLWPQGENRSSSVSALTSLRDISATLGADILKITNSVGNYSLGLSLKSLSEREFLIADSKNILMLISQDKTTIYDTAGDAYIEQDGKHLPISPNLEDLIQSTRDLNRFMR